MNRTNRYTLLLAALLTLLLGLAGCSNLHVQFAGSYCGEEVRNACAR